MDDFEIVNNTKAKSDVWRHFGLKKRKSDSTIVEGIAVCHHCNMTPKTSGGGTTNLVTHLRRHHPSINVGQVQPKISAKSVCYQSPVTPVSNQSYKAPPMILIFNLLLIAKF